MTDHQYPRRSDPATEADAWLLTLSEQAVSRQVRLDFVRWLKRSPVHVEEYLRIAAIRSRVKACDIDLSALEESPAELNRVIPWPGAMGLQTEKPRRRWAPWLTGAIAAALVGLALLLALPEPVDRMELRTALGETQTLRLDDGTELILNTDTHATAEWRKDSRVITLHRGQLYVDVAPDKRPLKVIARDAVLTDIGTQFDVYVRKSDTLVTVLDGHVVVAPPADHNNGIAPEPTLVSAGQRAAVGAGGRVLDVVAAPKQLDWQQHRLEFEDMTLEEIVAEFSRYNTMTIYISNKNIAQMRLSGSFATDDLNSFLSVVEHLPDVHVNRISDDYTRIARKAILPPKG